MMGICRPAFRIDAHELALGDKPLADGWIDIAEHGERLSSLPPVGIPVPKLFAAEAAPTFPFLFVYSRLRPLLQIPRL
jgi:hypothetical protein